MEREVGLGKRKKIKARDTMIEFVRKLVFYTRLSTTYIVQEITTNTGNEDSMLIISQRICYTKKRYT